MCLNSFLFFQAGVHSGRFLISSSGVHSGKFLISSSSSAQLLTCKCLNFQTIEPHFPNYEFLNMCRVLYRTVRVLRETPPLKEQHSLRRKQGDAWVTRCNFFPSINIIRMHESTAVREGRDKAMQDATVSVQQFKQLIKPPTL